MLIGWGGSIFTNHTCGEKFNDDSFKHFKIIYYSLNSNFCQAFREFYRQVREMHKQGLLELDWEDQELIETDIGECIKLNGEIIPLDVPFLEFTEPMARQAAKDADLHHNILDFKEVFDGQPTTRNRVEICTHKWI